MKKYAFFLTFFLGAWTVFASGNYAVNYLQPAADAHQLEFTVEGYDLSHTRLNGQVFTQIHFDGNIRTRVRGYASLPYLSATLQLPPDKNADIEVVGVEYTDIPLDHPLVPSRGVIYRDQDPSEIPYEIEPASVTDEWYPEMAFDHTQPFILRDVRGLSVYVHPFRYNPARNVLRVYSRITLLLTENNTEPVNPLLKPQARILKSMDAVYRSVFINYSTNRDDLNIDEAGDILVIATDRDGDAIQDYIQWKREKGYEVSLETVSTGTNVESLIQQAYDDNNDLLYVQLVGDWPDIKSNTLGYGSPMDPQLGCVAGSDDYADLCIGRFSSSDTSHVIAQTDKIIAYEKTPDPGNWYEDATGIASSQGPGDDNETDDEHSDVIFYDKLEPFTYENFNTVYDPAGTSAMVSTAVNDGTGVINYTGHGSPSGWGSSGFSISNVQSLVNAGKYPFIVSVACNNGDFHQSSGDCFAEAWLKKEDAGAVMFLGATISQPWDPPMRGQDYFMDVLTGGYDYTAHSGQSGISTSEQRTTIGSVVFNGLTLMCTESGGSDDWETAKTWTMFGDPSMQVRTAEPAPISLTNTTLISGIPFQTTISTSGGPVEGAMVAISQDGTYLSALTDATGSVTINQTFDPGTALLVVTGLNLETYYGSVDVIPPSGAYVIYAGHEVNDLSGNGNGMIDYGETAGLSVSLTNIGSDNAANVEVLLNTGDEYITVLDSLENYGSIPAGDTILIENAFEIEAGNDIPDMHMIMFELQSEGDEVWTSSFTDIAHAPVLTMAEYQVDDPAGNQNGKLDPGETAEITVTVTNTGSSSAFNVIGELISNTAYVNVTTLPQSYGQLDAGGEDAQVFTVEASEETPPGFSAGFGLDISAELGITGQGSFFLVVGQIPVLVIDLDGNNNSGTKMMTSLDNLGVGSEYVTSMPDNLGIYSSVFLCLGVYPENHVLTGSQGDVLADYLDSGGRLYMEGGDTWAFDAQTAVHAMFNIDGVADGSNDMSELEGQEGGMCADMDYSYSGDNNYMDHIEPMGNAGMIFMNAYPSYGAAIASAEDPYKTVGASFEFGGLDDGDTTRDDLMAVYLEFFGIGGMWTGIYEPADRMASVDIYPNPADAQVNLVLTLAEAAGVRIELFSMTGRKLKTLQDKPMGPGDHHIRLTDTGGLSSGIYMLKISTGSATLSRRLVIMH